MSQVIDLGALTATQGFVIQGDVAYDMAGYSVSSAGDVNGDGFDDIVLGAIGNDNGGSYAGAAYLIFGKAGGFGPTDLTGLAPGNGVVIQGDAAGDWGGVSVSSAGDINDDGFDDIVVGARYNDAGGGNAGAAYVIFGKASGFGPIDLTALASANGFVILGDAAGDQAGRSVSSAGDINGDGFADIIVGAIGNDNGGADAGAAYVIFGKAGGLGAIDLGALAPVNGFVIQGDAAGDRAGRSISSAGDVNGDGFDDLIVGAAGADGGGANAGAAYVIFGKASGFGTIDLTALAPTNGFAIQGDAPGDLAGVSVSSAGDINGDGFADIIVGALGNDSGGNYAGAAYVIFGKASGFGAIDLTALAPPDGFVIRGDATYDQAGISVSSAGDVNGDGFDDVIIGADGNDADGNYAGGFGAGSAYVIFGKASGFGAIDLTTLASADGFVIEGDRAHDHAGFSVSSAGDVNGDGFADIIVGAPYNNGGGGSAGEAYVIFGAAPTTSVTRIGSVIGQTIHGGVGDDYLDGREGDDLLLSGDGDNQAIGGAGNDRVDGGRGNDALSGRQGVDWLVGRGGEDDLSGGSGKDRLDGGVGNDTLFGDNGRDILIGGGGKDSLTGGSGADEFRFRTTTSGATLATADTITDFSHADGDRIDLSRIDAIAGSPARDAFHFIGNTAFSGTAGELRVRSIGGDTIVQADTDGDKIADFMIRLTGSVTLAAADFIGVSAAPPLAAAHAASFQTHADLDFSATVCLV